MFLIIKLTILTIKSSETEHKIFSSKSEYY